MNRAVRAALAALLVTVACDRPAGDAEQREFAARALPDILTYPKSVVTQVAAGSEAAEVTLTVQAPPEQVARWYRQVLAANGWSLQADARQPSGALVIHARKDARPLWVTVRPNIGGAGTTYTLVGVAPPDSQP
jgi:hypothetical protein